jgi:hypothetical protein
MSACTDPRGGRWATGVPTATRSALSQLYFIEYEFGGIF